MIKTAVILAAGSGTRFKEKTTDKPKGFINFLNKPMVVRSIENLIEVGIETIIIGTGHKFWWFEKLKNDYPQINCCKIENYGTRGSLFTLFGCRNLIKDDFLLLESDIIYEKEALKAILKTKERNVVLTTSLTKFQDQFYVEKDNQSKLINCSFNKNELNKIDGEWAGINKIAFSSYKIICDIISNAPKQYEKSGYEKMFLHKSLDMPFYIKYTPNLLWYEIDCKEDLIEAERIFYETYKKKAHTEKV